MTLRRHNSLGRMTQKQAKTMISKVQRAGKKLHLLKGEHAEFEEAVIDFKVDF